MSFVEIFRSPGQTACEQRAFVLRAVGIPTDIILHDTSFLLLVRSEMEQTARHHLERYAAENAPAAPPPPPPVLHRRAWIAPAAYALGLITIAYLAGENAFNFDWYAVGALSSSLQVNHEWWRAATALTLHADHEHLLRNIGFGALFSYPAARLMGSGVTVAAMLFAAVLGNILDSALMPRTHISIGASTMVFAALGIISAYSWRLRFDRRMRWAHRWAPLVVGVALLGLLGSGGENTDVLAHLTGFACGVFCGVGLALLPANSLRKPALQIAMGGVAVAIVAGAWRWAAPQ